MSATRRQVWNKSGNNHSSMITKIRVSIHQTASDREEKWLIHTHTHTRHYSTKYKRVKQAQLRNPHCEHSFPSTGCTWHTQTHSESLPTLPLTPKKIIASISIDNIEKFAEKIRYCSSVFIRLFIFSYFITWANKEMSRKVPLLKRKITPGSDSSSTFISVSGSARSSSVVNGTDRFLIAKNAVLAQAVNVVVSLKRASVYLMWFSNLTSSSLQYFWPFSLPH